MCLPFRPAPVPSESVTLGRRKKALSQWFPGMRPAAIWMLIFLLGFFCKVAPAFSEKTSVSSKKAPASASEKTSEPSSSKKSPLSVLDRAPVSSRKSPSSASEKSPAPLNEASVSAVEIISVRPLFDIKKNAVTPPLNQPSAVSVDPEKRIWVLDGVNSRVVGFSSQGKYLTEFGRKGSNAGEFKSPLGLSIDSRGFLYVADSKNHRIQVLDERGNQRLEVYIPPDKYGCLSDPTDIVLDEEKQRVIVVDNDNHRVLIYSWDYQLSELEPRPDNENENENKIDAETLPEKDENPSTFQIISDIGGIGYEEANFRYPYTGCIDKAGNIYVVDVINTRVQVFTPEGNFIRSIGEWGIEKGQFFRPQSICIDRQERVLVGENYNKIGLIQVFDLQGNLLGIIGDSQKEKIRFQVPSDLYIDQQNRLYVVQMYTSVISIYSFVD